MFPPCGVRFPQMGHGMFGVFPNTFLGQMSQHWYPSQFTNLLLRHLLIPCLSIDAGRRPREHVAHWFWLFAPLDWKFKMVLQPRPRELQGVHHIPGAIAKVIWSLVEPFELTRVLFSRMLHWFQICILTCSLFCNSLGMAFKCILRSACLEFLIF